MCPNVFFHNDIEVCIRNLSKDAVVAFRDYIKKEIGNEYLPESALNYSGKKAKNAQEAHEAQSFQLCFTSDQD